MKRLCVFGLGLTGFFYLVTIDEEKMATFHNKEFLDKSVDYLKDTLKSKKIDEVGVDLIERLTGFKKDELQDEVLFFLVDEHFGVVDRFNYGLKVIETPDEFQLYRIAEPILL